MKYAYSCFLFGTMIFISCNKGHEMKTNEGFKYVLYTESKGAKPRIGDYVTITMSYSNSKDSVIFDWKKSGSPIRFQLERFPFAGSFEQGLTYLSENDSATFFVPADSLYKVFYSNSDIPQSSTSFIPGSFFKFNIRLLKVQTPAQAEEEILLKQSVDEKNEWPEMKKYVDNHHITASLNDAGYYLEIKKEGNGDVIDSGKVVTVEYEGRYLNDSIFDGTKKTGHPYQFIHGAHRVIRGWEIAMKNLKAGSKITLVVHSKLAYGPEGLKDPANAKWIIQPNMPMVFDIDILKVENAPAVSNN